MDHINVWASLAQGHGNPLEPAGTLCGAGLIRREGMKVPGRNSWVGRAAVAAVVCLSLVSAASAEIVAEAWGYVTMSVVLEPWESHWVNCGGSSVSDIYSHPYMGDSDHLYELNGDQGFTLSTHVAQPDVANMAQGSAEVTRSQDGAGRDMAYLRIEGTAELSGPDYYLSDFASASHRASAEGLFSADQTRTYRLDMSGWWRADLRHAYEHVPGTPSEERPEVSITLRAAVWDPNGSNLLQPNHAWTLGADGALEMSFSSQTIGYLDSGSEPLQNVPCQLVAGEEYLLATELIVEVQSPGGYVPEPATLSLLALGGLALIRRRRTA